MTRCALVTGGARRVGEAICRHLHARGYRVLVHTHHSVTEGEWLVRQFNEARPGSALLLTADLSQPDAVEQLAARVRQAAPELTLLVNNAAAFFPTPLVSATGAQWDALLNTNLRAPFFLVQGLHETLAGNDGCIVNIADIYAERPPADHSVYALTKAGLVSLTRSLARDLAPRVRVNAVSPGAILWPENASEQHRQQLIARIALRRAGTPADIAHAVAYLAEADYVTGQVLAVDGGRSLNM